MNVIFKKEITEYYSQPFADMFNDLEKCNRDSFDNEFIVITANNKTYPGIWKHFFSICEYLDIPQFFIKVHTNNSETQQILSQYDVECILTSAPMPPDVPITTRFDYPETTCLYPFTSLDINNRGKIRPCCMIKGYLNDNGVDYSIQTHSLQEAWQSNNLENIRNAFLKGDKPNYCSECWNPESMGQGSQRLSYQYELGSRRFTTDFWNPELITLDVKTGFSCNLKCRICWHGDSSTWYSEDRRYTSVPAQREIDYTLDINDSFWETIADTVDDIVEIRFSGGEPFLDRKHIRTLQRLIELGKTNTRIHYITNGTQYPTHLLEILHQFDQVAIAFSIDNTEEKFDYERHGSDWSTVINNLEKFSALDRSKFFLTAHPTISVFNILDLDKIVDLYNMLNFDYVLHNLLEDPSYFSVYNIPKTSREEIKNRLLTSKHVTVRNSASLLDTETYLSQNLEFWNRINEIDQRRGENFRETYKDMALLMQERTHNG